MTPLLTALGSVGANMLAWNANIVVFTAVLHLTGRF